MFFWGQFSVDGHTFSVNKFDGQQFLSDMCSESTLCDKLLRKKIPPCFKSKKIF